MDDENIVKKGDKVYVHFMSKLEDGMIINSSLGKQPILFTVGAGEVINGLDVGVEGMHLGERKTLIIAPEDAFGNRSNDFIKEIPKYSLRDAMPEVGREISLKTPSGRIIRGTIIEVKNDTVMIDTNHPLSGKTIIYEIKVMKIN